MQTPPLNSVPQRFPTSPLPGTPRFSKDPESVRIKGGNADSSHPSAFGFSVVNRRCVLLTSLIHPFIFHALQACSGKDADATSAIFANYSVSSYPDLPTRDDIAWFETHWTGDIGRLRELTCSGRVWKNIKTDDGAVSVISFWSDAAEVRHSILCLIVEALDLSEPIYFEFMDSVAPLRLNRLAIQRKT